MIRRLVRSLLFLAFLAIPAVAMADPITFLFTGIVTNMSPPLSGTFAIGQTISGSYTFESTLSDTDPDPHFANYAPLTALDLTIGGYTATLLGTSGIGVANDSCCAAPDQYGLDTGLSGPSVGGLDPLRFFFLLTDSSGTAFASDALPLTPPDLSSFTSGRGWVLGFGTDIGGPSASLGGQITSLEPIPEPGTLLLLGSGLAGLVGYGRKKFRRKPSS